MIDTSHYAPDFRISIGGVGLHQYTPFGWILNDRPIDVTSVTINETVNSPDTFNFSLRSRNLQLERFPNGDDLTWIDDDSLKLGTLVTVDMGYVGNRALQLLGKITATSLSFAESGLITVRVEGQSLYGDLQRQHVRQAYANRTDSAIASLIASAMNLDTELDATSAEHDTVSNRDASLAAVLEERARRLYYEVKVRGRKLYFQQPRYLVDLHPVLTLSWGESLLSFTPRIKTHGMATQVVIRNERTGQGGDTQPFVAVADASSAPPRLGRRSGPEFVREMWGETTVLSEEQQVSTQEEAQTAADARYRSAAIDFIEADGATIGEPQLVSQSVIELLGLGTRLSGLYYVTSTSHTIDANGYRTNFHAKRDGI